MRLAGKKVLLIVAPEQFRDEELFVPRRLFEAEGARVTVVSTRSGQARGMLGGRVTATAAIDMTRADDYDAVLIIGGDGAPTHLWSHAGLRALVTEAAARQKLLGAICLGPVVLARAGLIAGQEVAVWRSAEVEAEVRRAGARIADDDVVAVGRLITGSGPLVALRWAGEIMHALAAKSER